MHKHTWIICGFHLGPQGKIYLKAKCECGAQGYVKKPNTKDADRSVGAAKKPFPWQGKNTEVEKI